MNFLKTFQTNVDTAIDNFVKLRKDKIFIKNLNLASKQLINTIKNNGKIIFAEVMVAQQLMPNILLQS